MKDLKQSTKQSFGGSTSGAGERLEIEIVAHESGAYRDRGQVS